MAVKVTMGPAHAIKAAAMLGAKWVLPIHYNTFPPIQQDAKKFIDELHTDAGIEGARLWRGRVLSCEDGWEGLC